VWLIAPALLFIAVFFLVPLGYMVVRSLTDPSPANYLRFNESPVYLRSLWTTIWMSGVVTATCLALGFPYAYAMSRSKGAMLLLLSVIVLLPFWSSLLVRTYAWTVLLRDTGIINRVLLWTGVFSEPITFMGTKTAVVIGMSHVLLPFMVLPILASMQRFDRDLDLAASGLGARPLTIFRRVFVPLTLPGVLAGCLLVFVLSVGFYITPAILGGRIAFFSMLIVAQISKLLDFGFGSTLGVVLLAVVLAILGIGSRFVPLVDLFGRPRR
jgi:putative spermidine/putrescine transport system permease protein